MPNAFLASAAVMTAKRNPETPSGAATLTPGFAVCPEKARITSGGRIHPDSSR
jgi:hypothetical protein